MSEHVCITSFHLLTSFPIRKCQTEQALDLWTALEQTQTNRRRPRMDVRGPGSSQHQSISIHMYRALR